MPQLAESGIQAPVFGVICGSCNWWQADVLTLLSLISSLVLGTAAYVTLGQSQQAEL